MPHYSFTTLFQLENKKRQRLITIYFNYYLPEHFASWHHPQLGSIDCLKVVDTHLKEELNLLGVVDLIRIKGRCWHYLEDRHLFIEHNIVSIPSK